MALKGHIAAVDSNGWVTDGANRLVLLVALFLASTIVDRIAQLPHGFTAGGNCLSLVSAEIVRRGFHVVDGILQLLHGLDDSRMLAPLFPALIRPSAAHRLGKYRRNSDHSQPQEFHWKSSLLC
jgi:hypothetical protein